MAAKNITPLEKRIMDFVWQEKIVTVRQVCGKLTRHRLAYTTVATLLERLCRKGLVEKRKVGKAQVFSARVSKESYAKQLAKNILSRFFKSYGDAAIASFAESVDKLPQEKRKYLLKLLKK